MSQKPLVIANFKLHGTASSLEKWCRNFDAPADVIAVVCPSYPYLGLLEGQKNVLSGAQNVASYEEGAYTGEVSAAMLQDLHVQYGLVGHSERRALFNETDEWIVKKAEALMRHHIVPVLCVGETQEERKASQTFQVIERQLSLFLQQPTEVLLKTWVVAYEPVWAIGTGLAATPQLADEVHAFIRKVLAEKNKDMAQSVQILYGGSVKPDNAAALAEMPHIDGALVGGASLDPQSFSKICRAFSAS